MATILLCLLALGLDLADGLGGCKVLDLTHALDRNNPHAAIFRPFDLQYKQRGPYKDIPYVEWNFYCTYEHLGTHIDAPAHFKKGAEHIDTIPLEQLIGEACVIDVRDKVNRDSEYQLTRQDIEDWESAHGKMGPECIALMSTGRAEKWADAAAYFGTSDASNPASFKYPGFSGESGRLLVERGVKSVGIDSISLDSSRDKAFGAHHAILADGGITGLENMGSMSELPPRGATIIAAPTKIRGGSGAQTRVFAIGWQQHDPCAVDALMMASDAPSLSSLWWAVAVAVAVAAALR